MSEFPLRFPPDNFPADNFSFSRVNSSAIDIESWLLLADEERIRVADNLPAIRPSLRREYFEELVAIEVRRERVRRVCLALLIFAAFLSVAYLPRFQPAPPVALRVPAEARRDQPTAPMSSEASAAMPEPMLAAFRHPDSWKLVDAYSEARQRHSQGFSGASRVTAPQ